MSAAFAIVIPALDEVRAIRAVVGEALALTPHVIVVDDGSSDGTGAAIADLPVTVLRHPAPQGKGAALRTGLRAALALGCDAVVTLDGDGQHAPADVPRLLAAHARQPRTLLLCARTLERRTQPGIRRFANHFADFWISWASGQRVLDSQCGQRLYPRALLEAMPLPLSDGFVFESEILIEAARHGFAIAAVEIRARYPADLRPSHFRPLRDVGCITRMVSWKLVSRGLYLRGLARSLWHPALKLDA
jgi:glycosyltransferase involved in cell wall biosynthesis